MIELIGWIGLIISFIAMIYHRYMYSNYDQVYTYIKKRYGNRSDSMEFPTKEDHSAKALKHSYYTIFFASLLILLNVYTR